MNIVDLILYIVVIMLSLLVTYLWWSLSKIKRFLKIITSKSLIPRQEKDFKIRRRYIVFTVISEHNISKRELEKAIREVVKELYGIIGLTKSDPQIIFYDPSVKRGVLRTGHLTSNILIASLSSVDNINGKEVLIIPIKTSGTLKRAKKYLYMIRE